MITHYESPTAEMVRTLTKMARARVDAVQQARFLDVCREFEVKLREHMQKCQAILDNNAVLQQNAWANIKTSYENTLFIGAFDLDRFVAYYQDKGFSVTTGDVHESSSGRPRSVTMTLSW